MTMKTKKIHRTKQFWDNIHISGFMCYSTESLFFVAGEVGFWGGFKEFLVDCRQVLDSLLVRQIESYSYDSDFKAAKFVEVKRRSKFLRYEV